MVFQKGNTDFPLKSVERIVIKIMLSTFVWSHRESSVVWNIKTKIYAVLYKKVLK